MTNQAQHQHPLFPGLRTERAGFRWPNLVGQKVRVSFDCETTGLDVHGGDRPVGFGVIVDGGPDSPREYISWGHASGPYLDEAACLQWARDNLLDGTKTIVGANLKFDFKMMRNVGVDFEGRCSHRDVLHEVALLSPDRRRNNLDSAALEFLGRHKLDPGKVSIHLQSSDLIEPYCLTDCDLARDLDTFLHGRLDREGLIPVFEMEQRLTWAVMHMEEEAFVIDAEKLARWRDVARSRQVRKMMQLSAMAGFRVDPGSRESKVKLFKGVGVTVFERTPTGDPSFTVEWMEQYSRHPEVALYLEIVALKSFREKYLDKYWDALEWAGGQAKLRFSLHQLRSDEGGTITGRTSSSAPRGAPGINAQQVFKVKEQLKIPVLSDMIVRELFIEEEGWEMFAADASQIEYRFFAHYVDDEAVTKVYRDDPKADFHQVIADKIGQDRDTVAKHANFAALFGAGLDKFAYMINMSVEDATPIWNWYHKSFPGVRRLSNEAQDAALRRGWVKTFLGRKRWLKGEEHKALNTICQGGAADYGKLTVLDCYERREDLGIRLRCFVHDEIVGGVRKDTAGGYYVPALLRFLNKQRMALRVPITWDVKVGRNWRM